MMIPDESSPDPVFESPDGRRYFMVRGTRWVDHVDGTLVRARQVFQEEDVKALELPERLGGGYLFHALSGQSTLMWRARTWAGDLTPLARVEPPASEIRAGFDRLYLESKTHHGIRGLDADSGDAMDASPLPRAAAYGDMAFSDAWTGVVLAGVRGPLVTFDAGGSWNPLGLKEPIREVVRTPSGAILLTTPTGAHVLDSEGRLVRTAEQGSDALFAGAVPAPRYALDEFPDPGLPPRLPASPLGRHPLRSAVLHGWPDTTETAIVVVEDGVGRVRLRDGKVLWSAPRTGSHPCRGVALGDAFGFVCGDDRSNTQIYSFRDHGLHLETSFDGPRAVRSSGNGALTIAGSCGSVAAASSGRTAPSPDRGATLAEVYCVRQASGALFEVRLKGDAGASRVVAMRDGTVVVVTPPGRAGDGQMSLVTPSGATQRDIQLTPEDTPGARLARSGLWLDPLWQTGEREIGGWVVGAQAYVGVRLDLEGNAVVAALQEGVDETTFHGPDALQIAGSATLRESTNHGFDWRVSELPPAVAGAENRARGLRGCGPVGCIRDGWLRIGFSPELSTPVAMEPDRPPPVARDSSPFSFWTLSCAPSKPPPRRTAGERSPRSTPATRSPARSTALRRVASAEPPESSAWLPFQGRRPPARGARTVGYDFGETNEHGAYRAYAWGDGNVDWLRGGSWLVRVGDRFSLDPPWSTAVTRSPWETAAHAGQTFGLDAGTGVDWWLRTEAAGRYAVIHVRVRSDNALHLLEPGRSIITLRPRDVKELGSVAGVHELRDRWYVGASRGGHFHLYRESEGRLEKLRSYPLYGRIETRLVSSVHGEELALWQRSEGSGWYVYPLDAETFDPLPALHLSRALLSRVPSPCAGGRPGWVVASGVPLTDSGVSESNTHLDFSGGAERLSTKRLTARLVLDDDFVCVDALSALTDDPLPPDLRLESRPSPRGALPLVVTHALDDSRLPFACRPQ